MIVTYDNKDYDFPDDVTDEEIKTFFEPEPGPLTKLGRGLYRGAVHGLPEQIGRAGVTLGLPTEPLIEWGKKGRGIGAPSALEQAGEMIPESALIPMAGKGLQMVSPLLGPAALPAKVLGLGMQYATPAIFGLAQAQQTRETAEAAGIDPGLAPTITGTIEWLGETLANKFLGDALGKAFFSKKISKEVLKKMSVATLAKGTVAEAVKNFALKVAPTEIGTEMLQNYLEAATEKGYGIRPDASPWEEAVAAIAPTGIMTALMAPFGVAFHRHIANVQADFLSKPTPAESTDPARDAQMRTQIAQGIEAGIPDEDVRKAWREYYETAIEHNKPIDIGTSLDKLSLSIRTMEAETSGGLGITLPSEEVAKEEARVGQAAEEARARDLAARKEREDAAEARRQERERIRTATVPATAAPTEATAPTIDFTGLGEAIGAAAEKAATEKAAFRQRMETAKKIKSLRSRGYTSDQIATMTPEEIDDIVSKPIAPTEAQPELKGTVRERREEARKELMKMGYLSTESRNFLKKLPSDLTVDDMVRQGVMAGLKKKKVTTKGAPEGAENLVTLLIRLGKVNLGDYRSRTTTGWERTQGKRGKDQSLEFPDVAAVASEKGKLSMDEAAQAAADYGVPLPPGETAWSADTLFGILTGGNAREHYTATAQDRRIAEDIQRETDAEAERALRAAEENAEQSLLDAGYSPDMIAKIPDGQMAWAVTKLTELNKGPFEPGEEPLTLEDIVNNWDETDESMMVLGIEPTAPAGEMQPIKEPPSRGFTVSTNEPVDTSLLRERVQSYIVSKQTAKGKTGTGLHKSVDKIARALNRFVTFVEANYPSARWDMASPESALITPQHVKDFQIYLESFAGREGFKDIYKTPLLQSTRHTEEGHLMAFFNGFYSQKKIPGTQYRPDSPMLKAETPITPRQRRTRPDTMAINEVTAILDAAESDTTAVGMRNSAIINVMYGAGLRRGEVARLKPEDIDFDNKTILVESIPPDEEEGEVGQETKSGESRLVPVSDRALAAIVKYQEVRRKFIKRTTPTADRKLLFLNEVGQSFRVAKTDSRGVTKEEYPGINRAFKKVLDKVEGVRKLHRSKGGKQVGWAPHDLRRAYATHLAMEGYPLIEIGRRLGHSQVAVTEEYIGLVALPAKGQLEAPRKPVINPNQTEFSFTDSRGNTGTGISRNGLRTAGTLARKSPTTETDPYRVISKHIKEGMLGWHLGLPWDIRGIKVNSPEDVAVIAQRFRSLQAEFLHTIYLKGNTIVHHECVSSRHPSATQSFSRSPETDADRFTGTAKKYGADRVVIGHNHPEGPALHSEPDTNYFRRLRVAMKGLLVGDYVTNHGEYEFYSPNPSPYKTDYKKVKVDLQHGADPLVSGDRIRVTSYRDMLDALAKKAMALFNGKNALIFWMQDSGYLNGIQHIPLSLLDDAKKASLYLKKQRYSFGGNALIFTFESLPLDSVKHKNAIGLFIDRVLHDIIELNDQGMYNPNKYIDKRSDGIYMAQFNTFAGPAKAVSFQNPGTWAPGGDSPYLDQHLAPGSRFSGPAYRITRPTSTRSTSAWDYAQYSSDILGNRDIVIQAREAMTVSGLDLAKFSDKDMTWVTADKESADALSENGNAAKVNVDGIVIAYDGLGYLVLKADAVQLESRKSSSNTVDMFKDGDEQTFRESQKSLKIQGPGNVTVTETTAPEQGDMFVKPDQDGTLFSPANDAMYLDEAARNNATFNGMQERLNKPSLPMFTDNVTKSTFLVPEGSTVADEVARVRESFAGLPGIVKKLSPDKLFRKVIENFGIHDNFAYKGWILPAGEIVNVDAHGDVTSAWSFEKSSEDAVHDFLEAGGLKVNRVSENAYVVEYGQKLTEAQIESLLSTFNESKSIRLLRRAPGGSQLIYQTAPGSQDTKDSLRKLLSSVEPIHYDFQIEAPMADNLIAFGRKLWEFSGDRMPDKLRAGLKGHMGREEKGGYNVGDWIKKAKEGKVSRFDKVFMLPWWMARKYGGVHRDLAEIFIFRRPALRGEINHRFHQMAEKFLNKQSGLPEESRLKVEKVLIITDAMLGKLVAAGRLKSATDEAKDLAEEIASIRRYPDRMLREGIITEWGYHRYVKMFREHQEEIRNEPAKTRPDLIDEIRNGILSSLRSDPDAFISLNDEEIETYANVRQTLDDMMKYFFDHMQRTTLEDYAKEPWFKLLEAAHGFIGNDSKTVVEMLMGKKGRGPLPNLIEWGERKIRVDMPEMFERFSKGLKARDEKGKPIVPEEALQSAEDAYKVIYEHMYDNLESLTATIKQILDLDTEQQAVEATKYLVIAYLKTRPDVKRIRRLRNQYGDVIGYFPRTRRDGKYKQKIFQRIMVKKKDELVPVDREIYSFLFNTREEYDEEMKKILSNPIYTENGKLIDEIDPAEMAEGIIGPGKLNQPIELTKTPEWAYQKVSDVNMMTIIDNAINKSTMEMGKAAEKMKGVLLDAVANELKARAWGSHLIRRRANVIKGYQEDNLHEVMHRYINGFSGMISKRDAARQSMIALSKADKKDTVGYEYAVKYTRDQLRNDTNFDKWSSRGRAMLFTWYLGGILRPAAVQITQNFVTGIPILQKKIREFKEEAKGSGFSVTNAVAEHEYLKAARDIGRAWGEFTGTEEAKQRTLKRWKGGGDPLSPVEREMQNELFRRGNTADQYMQWITGQMGTEWGRNYTKLIKRLGLPFSWMEQVNRQSAALAMFRLSWKHHKNMGYRDDVDEFGNKVANMVDSELYDRARTDAITFINDTHFAFGKPNQPLWTSGETGTAAIARTAMTFRSYTQNYANMMYYLAQDRDWLTMLHSLAYTALFGGLISLPFIKDLLELVEAKMGYSPRRAMSKAITGIGGEHLSDMAMYGIPTLLHANISGSLAMGLPFVGEMPEDTVFGVVWATGKKALKGAEAFGRGDYWRGAEYLAPEVIASPLKALRMSPWGRDVPMFPQAGYATTPSGKTIWKSSRQPLQLEGMDTFLKALGFNPLEYSLESQGTQMANRMEKYFYDWHKDITEAYKTAKAKGDRTAQKKLIASIRAYNLKRRATRAPVAPMTLSRVLADARRAMRKPEKREMRYLQAEGI